MPCLYMQKCLGPGATLMPRSWASGSSPGALSAAWPRLLLFGRQICTPGGPTPTAQPTGRTKGRDPASHLPPRKAPVSPLSRLSGNPRWHRHLLTEHIGCIIYLFLSPKSMCWALVCQALGHVFPLSSPFRPQRLFTGQVDTVILIY